jgi:hypothetical protein
MYANNENNMLQKDLSGATTVISQDKRNQGAPEQRTTSRSQLQRTSASEKIRVKISSIYSGGTLNGSLAIRAWLVLWMRMEETAPTYGG